MGSVLKTNQVGSNFKMSCYGKADTVLNVNPQEKLKNKLEDRTESYISRFQALSDKIA